MNAYSLVVVLHVVCVVVCAGPVLAIALAPSESARKLALVASFGLLGVLVTGIGAIALTGGALGQMMWLRVSAGLFLVIGGLTGRLRGVAKRSGAVQPLAWAITGLFVAVIWLMEAKPF